MQVSSSPDRVEWEGSPPPPKPTKLVRETTAAYLSDDDDGMAPLILDDMGPSAAEMYACYDLSTVPTPKNRCFRYCPDPRSLLDFKADDMGFSDPKRMAYGGYKVDLTYNGKPIIMQTPAMRVPFGLSQFKNPRGISKVMELDFYEKQYLPKTMDFFSIMRQTDRAILDACIKNRDSWMPGDKSKFKDNEIWKKYCGATRMRESKDGTLYQPRLTLKVWDNSALYDKKGKRIEFTDKTITKNCWVKCTFYFNGMFLGKEHTLGFRIDHMQLVDKPDFNVMFGSGALVSGPRFA